MQAQSRSLWKGSDSRLPQREESACLVLAHARRRWRYSRVSSLCSGVRESVGGCRADF